MSRLSLFPFLKRWKEKATILYHKALKRAFNVVILLFALIFALALIGYNLITIDARTPKINVQPIDVTYNVDDFVTPLSVDASVSDGGNLTFQWYSHTENSNSNGTLIESLDATDPTFTPTQSGYYYVVVTNTNDNATGSKTASVKSDAVQIVMPYKVSFYDANLGFIATKVAGGTINPNDLNSGVTTWYKANESSPTTEHNLTANINFYAIPNVQEIRTEAALNNVHIALSGKYILLNDIELTSATLDNSTGWNPIGDNYDNSFTGIFNGNGYKIINLWIDRPSTDDVGLFGYTKNAQIRNLGVEIDNDKGGVKGDRRVGGIAGFVRHNSSISNSYSTGDVSGTSDVGGIAGRVGESSITNSYSMGDVSGEKYVGGIAGDVFNSSITNSYSMGDVSAIGDYVGGIAGDVNYHSSIINSYSTGNVSAIGDYVGGIAGNASNSSISNSYSTGNVSAIGDYVGGIAGRGSSSITNSYSMGNVSGEKYVGGITGYALYSTIENNAAINQEISGSSNVNRIVGDTKDDNTIQNNFALSTMITDRGGVFSNASAPAYHGTSKAIAAFKSQSTYSNATSGDGLGGLSWKFGYDNESPWVWGVFDGYPYPALYWQTFAPSKGRRD